MDKPQSRSPRESRRATSYRQSDPLETTISMGSVVIDDEKISEHYAARRREFHAQPKVTPEQARQVAQVMVRDACAMNTSCYYAVRPPKDPKSFTEDLVTHNTYMKTDSKGLAEDEECCEHAKELPDNEQPLCQELVYHSVWCHEYVWWNILLGRPSVQNFFLIVALVLMANTIIEEPFNDRIGFWGFELRHVPHWVGHAVFFTCHVILLGLFGVLFMCMWPTRKHWLAKNLAQPSAYRSAFWSSTRATEQWWTLTFGVILLTSLMWRIMWCYNESHEPANNYPWYYRRRTIFGTLTSGFDVFWRAFRCYYLLFLSPKMRYGFVSALYVATKIGSIAGLVIISFIFHYFLITAFLPLEQEGESPDEYRERMEYFPNTNEGLFNLFVALTTANHPDVLMPSYHKHWYMMLLLFSFMCITNLFLLNVFLGVVTTQYSSMVKEFYLGKNKVCEGIMGSAFRVVVPDVIAVSRASADMGEFGLTKDQFMDAILLVQQSTCHELSAHDIEKQDLWFSLMDVDADKKINFEEFEKLSYIVNMPFCKIEPKDQDHLMFPTIRLFTQASLPLWLCPRWYKHKGHKLQKLNQARDNLQAVQERVRRLTAQREKFRAQSAKFKAQQDAAEEASATAGGLLDRRRTEFNDENVCILWGARQEAALQAAIQEEEQAEHLLRKRLKPKGTSTYNLVLTALIFVSIINALWINPAPAKESELEQASCWDSANRFNLVIGLLFMADCIIGFLSEATKEHPFRYLYGPYWFYNWTDIAVVVVTFAVFGGRCDDSNHSTAALYSISGLLRVLRCIRIIQHIESFKRMYNASTRVIPAITPQLLLFMTAYYAYAVTGMWLFAGCVTEVVEDGGPGDWSTPPWSSSVSKMGTTNLYGNDEFYYQNNFDNFYSSCMTLFMLMIQNNWHVTVDGFVQCTGTFWARAYFISFNCLVAMILINIFIGVVLDMFDLFWHDELYKMGMEEDDMFDGGFFQIISHRMHECTDENGVELYKSCDAVMLVNEVAKRVEMSGIKTALTDAPNPIYIRTQGNKIVFANNVFAKLYGKEVKQLVGSYQNMLLVPPYNEQRPCKHNHLALKLKLQGSTMCTVEYYEEATLPDGTEVIFRCVEKPIEVSHFNNTTVVHMYPLLAGGNMLLDIDGDGALTKADILRSKQPETANSSRVTIV